MVAGFMIGYLVYDLIHYATHHYPIRGGFMKSLKRHHMKHHFKEPNLRFGVSSTVWDHAFGTLPK
jgi:sterol desaturase/sphingolipid hydroxylase (fatty acid hydroxylase superfamily)